MAATKVSKIRIEGVKEGDALHPFTPFDRTLTIRIAGVTDEFAILTDPLLPHIGAAWTGENHPTSICRGIRPRSIDHGIGHWEIEYDMREAIPGGSQGREVRISRKVDSVRTWRVNPEIPSNVSTPPLGTIDSSGAVHGDIGGRAIDTQGQPADVPLKHHTITISCSVVAPLDELLIDAMLDTRNLTMWRGYPAGKVLFLGVDTDRQGLNPTIPANFSFDVDPWYHMRQLPVCSQEGTPIPVGRDQAGSGSAIVGQAKCVYFYQAFPLTSEFGALPIP